MKKVLILVFIVIGTFVLVYFLPIYTQVSLLRSQIVGTESPSESIEWRSSRVTLKNYFADLPYNKEYAETKSLTLKNIFLWLGTSTFIAVIVLFLGRKIFKHFSI